jgi:hypothetical protein
MKVWLGEYLRANRLQQMMQFDGQDFSTELMNQIVDASVPVVFLRVNTFRKSDPSEVPAEAEVGDLLMCHPHEW